MDDAALDTRPLGPEDLGDLASLFQPERNTRGCWCMSFCSSRTQFAMGWLTGGNRRRFEAMASGAGPPMGVLASVSGQPVGWCACGPRSRYAVADEGRSALLQGLDRTDDDDVWLLPCLFVRAESRGQGVTYGLVEAAVELARQHGARAIEGWPTAGSQKRSAEGFVGRERVFEALGFRCVARPSSARAIMRLELDGAPEGDQRNASRTP
ncbi:MAG: GNAT family N-acetyltransferase [Lapillicoccus sp.]